MKTRIMLIGVGMCLLVAVCWWLRQSIAVPHPEGTSLAPAPPSAPPAPAVTIASLPTPPSVSRTKRELWSEELAVSNDQPIEFYGRVVDQNGSPVAGAKVRGGVMVEKVWMGGQFVDHYSVTDGAGNFAFRGLRGAEIVIQPSKEGYEFRSDLHRGFFYSLLRRESERHHPASSAPEVFRMWKLKGPEPLVHNEINRVGVPVDGTAVIFDLLKGRRTTSDGDLIVTIERTPTHIQRGQRFDWKAVLEVRGGGLVKLQDAYPNEAPLDGYEEKAVIEMPAAAPEWQSSVFQRFYFKIRGGAIYGRLTIDITANYEPPPTGVTLDALLNPSGSRNLEFDPIMQVSPR